MKYNSSLLVSCNLFVFAIVFMSGGLESSLYAKKEVLTSKSKHVKAPKQKKSKKEKLTKQSHPYLFKQVQLLKEDEAHLAYLYYKTNQDTYLTIRCLERLEQVATDQEILREGLIELADYYFSYYKNMKKAAATYEKFHDLFPGDPLAEYALYKSIVCKFFITLRPERDQSDTEHIISRGSDFIKTCKNPEYVQEISEIIQKCYHRLYESEVHVMMFYINQKKWKSAQGRLDYIKEKYLDKVVQAQQEIDVYTKAIANQTYPVFARKAQTEKTAPKTKQKRLL
ncbi:outer membrane protein assembly factor BamD [bacterium]|nr:outer membrane protein assembly factor BamD [bacterium]